MEEVLAAELEDGDSFVVRVVGSPGNFVSILPVGGGHDLADWQVLPLRAGWVLRVTERGLAEVLQQRLELDGVPAAQVEDDIGERQETLVHEFAVGGVDDGRGENPAPRELAQRVDDLGVGPQRQDPGLLVVVGALRVLVRALGPQEFTDGG